MTNETAAPLSPAKALYGAERKRVILPACVHYAGNAKFIEKSFALQAASKVPFDVVLDLEDGAALDNQEKTLECILTYLASEHLTTHRVGVRLPPVETKGLAKTVKKLLNASKDRIAFFTLPKATGVRSVLKLSALIRQARGGKKVGAPPLHVLIETYDALGAVDAIARCSGVECLEFGILDFISEHRSYIPDSAANSPAQFTHPVLSHAKCTIVAAAYRAGITASHNISLALNDVQLTQSDALRAAHDFGFQRMWSIHPAQITPIIAAFTPEESAVTRAVAILTQAQLHHWAPIAYEDKLYDRASYRALFALVQRASGYRKTYSAQTASAIEALLQ